jgi:uncharacterized protein involved in exopolysaccharide biosynthesis
VGLVPASRVITVELTGSDPDRLEQALDAYVGQYIRRRTSLFNPPDQQQFLEAQAEAYREHIRDMEANLLENVRSTSVVDPEKEIEVNLDLRRELIQQLDLLKAERIRSGLAVEPSLERLIEYIEGRLGELNARNVKLQGILLDRQRIVRERSVGEFSYQLFSRREEEQKIFRAVSAASLTGEITVLRRAQGSAELLFPKPGQVLAVGVLAGAMLGVGLAMVREFLDQTFHSERQLAARTGAPVVASLPRARTGLR